MSAWKTVVGLEVHAELETASKMFSGCPVVDSVEAAPNSAVDPLSLGMPGTLPVINMQAMEYGIMVGLALTLRDTADQSVRAEKLFLSRFAQGLPDQPI